MGDRVYVIAGKDESLVGARCQELLDALLDPQQRMTGLSSVEGEEASSPRSSTSCGPRPF
jgi:hypothetical protein